MKILIVREHFKKGQLQSSDTSLSVAHIQNNESMPFGFARIENQDGQAVFEMTSSFDGMIKITENMSVAHTILNGVGVTRQSKTNFSYGDILVVHYTYVDEYLVSRDTVVLVPDGTPAQLRA